MKISVNGSPNLLAIAAKIRNSTVQGVHHALQPFNNHIVECKRQSRDWQLTIRHVVKGTQNLQRSLLGLHQSIAEIQPTITSISHDLKHWQRVNEVPMEKLNQLIAKYNQQ